MPSLTLSTQIYYGLAVHNMRPPDTSPPQHHTSDFPPMPRAPNPEVDEILRRLDARAKAQKLPETAPATPYREKVRGLGQWGGLLLDVLLNDHVDIS